MMSSSEAVCKLFKEFWVCKNVVLKPFPQTSRPMIWRWHVSHHERKCCSFGSAFKPVREFIYTILHFFFYPINKTYIKKKRRKELIALISKASVRSHADWAVLVIFNSDLWQTAVRCFRSKDVVSQKWKDPVILCNYMSCEKLILSYKALYKMASKLYSFLSFSSPRAWRE